MENVGTFSNRNAEFEKKFSREKILEKLVNTIQPTIFDVGAHKGESALFFNKIFPSANIHSFEPDPETFRDLQDTANEISKCHNLALANKTGLSSFFKNNLSHTNSILRVNLESEDSIKLSTARKSPEVFQNTATDFNKEITISTIRLDEFCQQNHISRINLLKIDTQGTEAEVLRGAGDLLYNVDNIILEICFFDFYEKRSSFFDVESVIRNFGFKIFSISQISNNPMNGRTDWVEAIYTK